MSAGRGIVPEHWQAHHPTLAQVEAHGLEALWIYRYGSGTAAWNREMRVLPVSIGRALGGGERIVAHAGPPISAPGDPCVADALWCAIRFDDRGIPHSYAYDRETGATVAPPAPTEGVSR